MPQIITRQGLERHLWEDTREEITLERDGKRATGRLGPELGAINSLGILSCGSPFYIFADNLPSNSLIHTPNCPPTQSIAVNLRNGDRVYIGNHPYITKDLKYTYEP